MLLPVNKPMKRLVVIFTIFFLISTSPAFAQLSFGGPAVQKKIEITISLDGDVHVSHLIQKSKSPVAFDVLEGIVSNINVKDVNGDEVEFGKGAITQLESITVFPSNEDVIVEYDLDDVLFQKNGYWTWDYDYPKTSNFILPEEIDLIFVNENPVLLEETRIISCHGCNLLLEYSVIEPVTHEISWEEKNFDVSIISQANIEISLDQSLKKISYDIETENEYVSLIIPLELLWNPYEIFLNDEKIKKNELLINSTHAFLNMKPDTSGTISIIGTSVIPEFPIVFPLVIGILMVVAIQFRNKIIIR